MNLEWRQSIEEKDQNVYLMTDAMKATIGYCCKTNGKWKWRPLNLYECVYLEEQDLRFIFKKLAELNGQLTLF